MHFKCRVCPAKEALNLATVLKSFKQSFSPVPALPANCHTDCFDKLSNRIDKLSLMFSCENISFVLRTHRCLRSMFTKVNIPFMYYVHSPWLSERESKLPIKLAKEWGGHRRGKPAALQRAGVPLLTFTNFELKLYFWADLSAYKALNPRGFIKL